ncbi:MAG TPA: ribonuclease H [Candidatus Dormibacteraeota bacterium]|nr:ribonuclease H [Candidatus Dormibacteraeota bacterium]
MSPERSTPRFWVDGYCDGACSGNPGPGGWAYRVEWPEATEEGSGGEPHTTNNRMELVAAREALQAFLRRREPGQGLQLHTDSRNVIGWLSGGWKRRANQDLFPEIDRLTALVGPALRWQHVRGHRDNPGNNRVDQLAVEACQRQLKAPSEPSPGG